MKFKGKFRGQTVEFEADNIEVAVQRWSGMKIQIIAADAIQGEAQKIKEGKHEELEIVKDSRG